MNYVLGIDGGGTKTVCILMDNTHQVIGRSEAGPSNYQSIGIESSLKVIETAIEEVVKNTGNLPIAAVCLGLAGVGRVTDIELFKGLIQELPIIRQLQPLTIMIGNDAEIALFAGIGDDVGIVVAVGTGSVVFGRNHQGITKRVGGWGYILGDEGSAYHIALSGMQAALKSYDGREIATSLIDGFKQHLNLTSIEDLVPVIYQQGWKVKEIAALAPVVDLAAATGDPIANKIIDNTVQEFVTSTSTVMQSIFNSESIVEVVTTGSVWRGQSKIHQKFTESITENFPLIKVIYPRYEPAFGACLLAWRGRI